MAERVVVRKRKTTADPATVREAFRVWALEKEKETNAKAVKERLRTDSLFPLIEKSGIEDEHGSLILTFESAIPITSVNADGVRKSTTYVGVKKERRVSSVFQEDEARAWLKAHRLLSKVEVETQVIVTRPGEEAESSTSYSLDQDLIYVLNQEGKIPDEVLDSWFEDKETWALVPLKA